MNMRTREESHRQRDITDEITGTRWCVGGNHVAPLADACIYRGKPYCTSCRDKARRARKAARA